MDSSSPPSSLSSSPREQLTFSDAAAKSRRTLSSSSSSSSSFHEDSLSATPLHYSSARVPFSWEKLPGLPKPSSLKINISHEPSLKILPLPPPITPPAGSRRLSFDEPSRTIRRASTFSSRPVVPRDPFFAALMECSGGGDGGFSDEQEFLGGGGGAKVARRSISDRFGFVGMYGSCKRTCAVSESIVCLPRSSPARPAYDLLRRRR